MNRKFKAESFPLAALFCICKIMFSMIDFAPMFGCKGSDLQNLAAVVKDENGERQIGLTSVNGVLTFQDINSSSVVIMNKSNNHAYVSDFVISFTDVDL